MVLANGYFVDPESDGGRIWSPGVTHRLPDAPCVVLLGEPAMGKSCTIQSLRLDLEKTLGIGHQSLWLDLSLCTDSSALDRHLFDSATLRNWRQGSHVLHLFLDSLDECLLQVNTVARLLLHELSQLPRERLRLRIVCRSAEWPALLETGLPSLFAEKVEYLELAPLRRTDVVEAARSVGVDADAFLDEVDRCDASPFAAKPGTLFLLLKLFKAKQGLPKTQSELYRSGCLQLCREESETRKASRRAGDVDAEERLLIAERIAALMAFCKRPTFFTGASADADPGDLTAEDVCVGTEVDGDRSVEVTLSAIREVLDTGLFSSRGPHRLGWAHQTYQEFLAARYVARKGLSASQISGLLMHPFAPTTVVPQLHETAAWLASMHSEMFEFLLARQPQVLLRSDADAKSDDTKLRLVDAVLQQLDVDRMSTAWELYRYFRRLKHPGLRAQLAPYLADRTKSLASRTLAVHLAEECRVETLQDALIDIALDQTENLELRRAATHAARKVADVARRSRLRPLAAGDPHDGGDSLKAEALNALWPQCIDAKELFGYLVKPKRSNHFGSYFSFAHKAVKHLTPPITSLERNIRSVRTSESNEFA